MKFLWFLFLPTVLIAAESCPELRLDSKGGLLENTKPVSQGFTSLCYAFTVSQMLDAFQKKYNSIPADKSSAFAIAVASSSASGNDTISTGIPYDAFAEVKKIGLCPAKILEGSGEGIDVTVFEGRLKYFYNLGTGKVVGEPANRDRATKLIQEYLADKYSLQRTFSKAEIQTWLKEKSFSKFLLPMVQTVCKGQMKPFNNFQIDRDYSTKYASSKARAAAFSSSLNSLLSSKQSLPVGVNFCNAFVEEPTVQNGIDESGANLTDVCGNFHTALLIGQRKKKGKCQVLVRDSQGEFCTSVHKKWDCVKGQYWLDRDQLFQNSTEVYFLKKLKAEPKDDCVTGNCR